MLRNCTSLVRILVAAALVALAGSAAAQPAYPAKPIRLVIPYVPGGSSDVVARVLGSKMTEKWGQQVLIDNRGGGNTIIGTEAVAKAPPDGYTILQATSALVTVPQMTSTSFDPIKDFAPVATLTSTAQVLVLHPSVPVNAVQQLIALAKSKPGQLNYASSGSGSSNHLAGEFFNMLAGTKIQHVPYKGSGPAVTDLLGGWVQLSLQPPSTVIAHIKSGKLKAIAIAGDTRLATLPQVPTFIEAGMPDFDAKGWQWMLAPAGTPKEIVDKLSSEIGRILRLPESKEKLASLGMETVVFGPEKFSALLKDEMVRYARIVKAGNIKMEN